MQTKILLTEKQVGQIREHTRECYPAEMCGFLTTEDFIPTRNISETPEKSFTIDPIDYVKNFKEAIAVIHSHTSSINSHSPVDLRTPSYADYINQQKTGKPWLIVGCDEYSISDAIQFPRVPSKDYVGRVFQWFTSDCYNLVQDFYRFELDIILPDAIIKESYNKLRLHNNIFDEYIESYGFKEVSISELRDNDLLLIDTAGFHGNHLGIYTKGQVLHQDLVSSYVHYEEVGLRVTKVLRYDK